MSDQEHGEEWRVRSGVYAGMYAEIMNLYTGDEWVEMAHISVKVPYGSGYLREEVDVPLSDLELYASW